MSSETALDVFDRHRLVGLQGGEAVGSQLAEALVVVGAAQDRLLEDRGVRRDSGHRVLTLKPLELPVGEHRATQ